MNEDIDDNLAKRKFARTAHLDRLKKLANQNWLMTAEPHLAIDSSNPANAGFNDNLIVAEFNNLKQAKS